MAPSCGIGILLNLSISGGLMPTLFRRTIHGEYTERTDNIATSFTALIYRRSSFLLRAIFLEMCSSTSRMLWKHSLPRFSAALTSYKSD
jgi:hypothetical protein